DADSSVGQASFPAGRPTGPPLVQGQTFVKAVYSTQGALVATSTKHGYVSVHDTKTGKLLFGKRPQPSRSARLAFSPDDRLLGAGLADGSVLFWPVQEPSREHARLQAHAQGDACLGFSPDGNVLATGTEWDTRVRLWRVADGELLDTLEGAHGVRHVRF